MQSHQIMPEQIARVKEFFLISGKTYTEPVANPKCNTRNGKSKKTLKGEFGELPIDIPRDRDGSFEPQIVPKHQTRWTGFDDKILSLYC
jgi:putative transposase